MMHAAEDEDRRLRRTTIGVHKDDVVFTLGEHALKRLESRPAEIFFGGVASCAIGIHRGCNRCEAHFTLG